MKRLGGACAGAGAGLGVGVEVGVGDDEAEVEGAGAGRGAALSWYILDIARVKEGRKRLADTSSGNRVWNAIRTRMTSSGYVTKTDMIPVHNTIQYAYTQPKRRGDAPDIAPAENRRKFVSDSLVGMRICTPREYKYRMAKERAIVGRKGVGDAHGGPGRMP